MTKGTNQSLQLRHYCQQHDEDWPMIRVEGGSEGKTPGPGFPQGRIVVQRELHSVTSVISVNSTLVKNKSAPLFPTHPVSQRK